MTQRKRLWNVSCAARIVVAALCWQVTLSLSAAANPLSLSAVSTASSLRASLAAALEGRAGKGSFDLGLELGIAQEWIEEGEAEVQHRTGPPIVLPTANRGSWAHPTPPDQAVQATVSGAEAPQRLPEKPYGWEQLKYDLTYVYRKPAHLDAKERRAAFAIAGTTGLLYVFRDDIQEAWQDNRSDSRTDFLNSARIMGGAGFAPAVALAAFGVSFLTDNDRELETAQLVLESWALSAVGSGLGSFILAVERPEDGDAIRFFALDGHGVSYDVSVAASVIPPLRRQYLRVGSEDGLGLKILKHGLSVVLYSGMVFTALQRIDADKHWAPDVFLGMVNGLGVGRVLGQAHDQARQRRSTVALSVLPGGLAVTWTLSLGPR